MKKEGLLEQIEILRASLQTEAAQKGLRHHKVIEISQELDKKIVQFQLLSLAAPQKWDHCKGWVGAYQPYWRLYLATK